MKRADQVARCGSRKLAPGSQQRRHRPLRRCLPSILPLGLQSHAPASSSCRRPRRVTRFVVYLRVSTLRQGASGLGIEAQRDAVARHVASAGGRSLAEVVETESGKQSTRPQLARALAICRVSGRCARRSWRDPTGESPVRVRHSEPPGNECCGRCGNAGSEAYTVIAWGVGLSHEMTTLWRPRPSSEPKATCVAPRSRGAIAPPGSEATSRAKGSCRNLGDPAASAGMVTGGGSQRGITGADCTAAGSRTGP